MNVLAIVQYLHPGADPLADFNVTDKLDGQGPVISAWYLDAPRPSAAELKAAEPAALLAQAKRAKLAELTSACEAEIGAGYRSDALGSVHLYPNSLLDQTNMQASVLASVLPGLPGDWTTPFTCIEPANAAEIEWPMKLHSAAQIQQAGEDGKAWILARRAHFHQLIGQVRAAQTVASVETIVWSEAGQAPASL